MSIFYRNMDLFKKHVQPIESVFPPIPEYEQAGSIRLSVLRTQVSSTSLIIFS